MRCCTSFDSISMAGPSFSLYRICIVPCEWEAIWHCSLSLNEQPYVAVCGVSRDWYDTSILVIRTYTVEFVRTRRDKCISFIVSYPQKSSNKEEPEPTQITISVYSYINWLIVVITVGTLQDVLCGQHITGIACWLCYSPSQRHWKEKNAINE